VTCHPWDRRTRVCRAEAESEQTAAVKFGKRASQDSASTSVNAFELHRTSSDVLSRVTDAATNFRLVDAPASGERSESDFLACGDRGRAPDIPASDQGVPSFSTAVFAAASIDRGAAWPAGASASRQLASVRNLGACDWPNLGGLNGRHGSRMAVKRREFHLKGLPVRINVHHGPNVTNFQSFLWKRRGQNDAFVFSNQIDF